MSIEDAAMAPRPGIASRLREAGRLEFSERGYHGARVQGIARRADCNVALLYRHWTSKKALYLEVLRAAMERLGRSVTAQFDGASGPAAVVDAYVDAHMRDPCAATLIVRELLDGGPFLTELMESHPALREPLRTAAATLAAPIRNGGGSALRAEVEPMVAVMSIAGLAALVASAHGATKAVTGEELSADAWRGHLHDLLLHGLAAR